MMNKKTLRHKYKKKRKQLSDDQITQYSISIANRLLELSIWDWSFFHIFLSILRQREIDTTPILSLLQGRDKNIIISRCALETKSMTHVLLTDSTKIKVSSYGIPEPVDGIVVPSSQIDVVFVPLMAYDNTGHRVGYGEGIYDRFLEDCRPDVLKVGLSFFSPEEKIKAITSIDKPMDIVVTPHQVYYFS